MTKNTQRLNGPTLRNWVAKYANRLYKAVVHPDRTTYRRQAKHRKQWE